MERRKGFCCFVLAVVVCVVALEQCGLGQAQSMPSPSRFLPYFQANRLASGLPLSYYVPSNYYPSIPANEQVAPGLAATEPMVVPQCNNETIPVNLLNAYTFQTEQFLATLGLNIYDASVETIALSILGEGQAALDYMQKTLVGHQTLQFQDIKGDAPCKGIIVFDQCSDPEQTGRCGFCYGDSGEQTLPTANAWFFRMISDYYALEGTLDARCPQLGHEWVWNDYKPILGENSWANLIGPLNVLTILKNDPTAVSIATQLLTDYLPALQQMFIPSINAIYYAPHNTYSTNFTADFEISTENQASTLAGLKAALYFMQQQNVLPDQITLVKDLISSLQTYLQSAYSSEWGYFHQGGNYNGSTKTFTWVEEPFFATDCQTWVMSVLGPELVDSWFGAGTAYQIWQNTKKIAGYNYNPTTNMAAGVGFTENPDQVFSGEWTFGAINMLRIFANEYQSYNSSEFLAEATYMRQTIDNQLLQNGVVINNTQVDGINYANKRYYIPFGWWANPLLATASTGWAVLADSNYNPFILGGAYVSSYPSS